MAIRFAAETYSWILKLFPNDGFPMAEWRTICSDHNINRCGAVERYTSKSLCSITKWNICTKHKRRKWTVKTDDPKLYPPYERSILRAGSLSLCFMTREYIPSDQSVSSSFHSKALKHCVFCISRLLSIHYAFLHIFIYTYKNALWACLVHPHVLLPARLSAYWFSEQIWTKFGGTVPHDPRKDPSQL